MSVPTLRALVDSGYDVALVITRADTRRGRGAALQPSPVKAAAVELGIPVSTDVGEALHVGADAAVVVAFGRLIGADVLDQLPMLNVHFSRLPRWRGAAPVERAILAGDETTGVDIMAIDVGLDEGGIYASRQIEIGPDETAAELRTRLVDAGTALLLSVLDVGVPEAVPQRGDASYAAKLDPTELEIDFTRPSVELHRLVRVGGAWTTHRGKRLKVWRTALAPPATPTPGSAPAPAKRLAPGELDAGSLHVGTGDGTVELLEVQPEGKGRQPAAAWRNGAHLGPAEHLGPATPSPRGESPARPLTDPRDQAEAGPTP